LETHHGYTRTRREVYNVAAARPEVTSVDQVRDVRRRGASSRYTTNNTMSDSDAQLRILFYSLHAPRCAAIQILARVEMRSIVETLLQMQPLMTLDLRHPWTSEQHGNRS
jgi:hypothetical protein